MLHQVYGLSETTGSLTEMAPEPDLPADSPAVPLGRTRLPVDRAGDPRPGDRGSGCRRTTFGEVWTRSAQNSPGYFGLPEETAALLTPDGWLRTGDGGHLDDDGYLFLTDRVKDMIISGGENVYPAEVEAVLRRHPAVADVAVFGVPDDRWGEAVAAAVVLARRPGDRRRADRLHRRPAGRLQAAAHGPLVDELPRNAAGKVPPPAAGLRGRRPQEEPHDRSRCGSSAFVNHIAPAPDIEDEIARALEWGVDVIVAQGTGSDWGPYWLGSGEQVSANQAANVEPYVRAALAHGIPFVFSFGIAGGDVHLETCLRAFDELCAATAGRRRLGVVRSEIGKDYLRAAVADGPAVVPAARRALGTARSRSTTSPTPSGSSR